MGDDKTVESVEIQCQEERRTARLMVEWREERGRRTVVGIQCDNPRFHDLKPWECHWSCWDRVARRGAQK